MDFVTYNWGCVQNVNRSQGLIQFQPGENSIPDTQSNQYMLREQLALNFMLLVADSANIKWWKKNPEKMTETLAHGYSSKT